MLSYSKFKKKFSTPIEKLNLSGSSWFLPSCFLILTLSNAFLSYLTPSLLLKVWIVLLGLMVPSFLVFISIKNEKKILSIKTTPSIPLWVWAALGTFALILRLFHLTSLSSWPLYDEGMFGYFATLLEKKWDWRLVHGFAEEPVLYMWGQFLFFKAFSNSLVALWLFPAACSILSVLTVWGATRKMPPSSTAFFAFCWMAFGFWPLYAGRFSGPYILMVLWECFVFFALVRYLSGRKRTSKSLYGLAILTGLGFYIYLAWPMIALLVTLTLLMDPSQIITRRLKTTLLFLVVMTLTVSPFLFTFAREYKGYLNYLWSGGSEHHWIERAFFYLSYFTDLFWGNSRGVFRYGPLWGGLLNPFLSSFFFLGFLYLLRSCQRPFSFWTLSAFFLFSLPAFLSNSFELMRLISWLPVVMVICAIGTQLFLSRLPSSLRMLVFFLVLPSSLSLDLYHLFYVYPRHWTTNFYYYGAHKSPEFYKAYSVLKPMADQQGPGLILLNFHPDPYDQTLFVATYSFNAAENPRLNPAIARWAAILTNIHELPYLSRKFPEGRSTWLSEGLNREDGGMMLETLKITSSNRDLLNRWIQADQSLNDLTYAVMELGVDPDQRQMLAVLEKAYPLFKDDHFLESRYWRIMALHHAAEGKIAEAAEDDKKGIEKGLPMAHLYNEMGCLWFKENRWTEAKKAFKNTLILKPNFTNAAANLQSLDRLLKITSPARD